MRSWHSEEEGMKITVNTEVRKSLIYIKRTHLVGTYVYPMYTLLEGQSKQVCVWGGGGGGVHVSLVVDVHTHG